MLEQEDFLEDIMRVRNKELKEILTSMSSICTYEKSEILSEIGEKERSVRFLIDGIVRGFIINLSGKDTTVSFSYRPGDIIMGSLDMENDVSRVTFEALKKSRVLNIPISGILSLSQKRHEVMAHCNHYMTWCLNYHWDTKMMLYLKTAEERYEWFLSAYPGLIDQVNHRKIASFLNISPITLSRVRSARTAASKRNHS